VFIPGFFWNCLENRFKRSKTFVECKRFIPQKRPRRIPIIKAILDFAGSVMVVVSFLDMLAWNIASLNGISGIRWMQYHDFYGGTLRLDQRWNMYAPAPRAVHGWLVVPANLADGSQIDLFTGQPTSWVKPGDIGAYWGDDRWRRYLSNLMDDQDPNELQRYADYLVNKWNESHSSDRKVATITIIFMKQITKPDLTITAPEQDVLYFHSY